MILWPAPGGAVGELEYQFELQSTLTYHTHWFSGIDPGTGLDPTSPANAGALRRRILLPQGLQWRNEASGRIYYQTLRTHWDLNYTFGYDFFAAEKGTIATPATLDAPAVVTSRWTGSSPLNSYSNRFEGYGRLELNQTTELLLVQTLTQARFNLISLPGQTQALPQTVNGFDISRLWFIGSSTRAVLDQHLTANWEMRPEGQVELFKTFGATAPELGSALTSRGIFTLRDRLLRRFRNDVAEAAVGWQYIAVSTPPAIANPDPTQPPSSQSELGRDYMVVSGQVGWDHQFLPWLHLYGRFGWAANMFAAHQAGDRVYHGPIGGLRLRIEDERWTIVAEYRRDFDTSIWGATVLSDDAGTFIMRRRIGERATLWADVSIDYRLAHSPNVVPPVNPGDPALGATVTVPQSQLESSLGGSVRLAKWATIDVFVTYRRQWGRGVFISYDRWSPTVMVSFVWPERRLTRMRPDETLRRLTQEPFEEERRTDRAFDEPGRRDPIRRPRDPDPGAMDTGGVPLRHIPPHNAPADWGGRPQPQPRPEGAPPPPGEPPDRTTPQRAEDEQSQQPGRPPATKGRGQKPPASNTQPHEPPPASAPAPAPEPPPSTGRPSTRRWRGRRSPA